jgi:uncharacterized protein YutE (UPF0331/DUF86 family)
MIDRDALSARLGTLEEYLKELRRLGTCRRDEFVNSPGIYNLAERYLHLACECVLDVAHHVIAESGFRQPSSYKETMDVLREQGLLDADLAERLKDWMGFRNVLVHFYLTIDHTRSHEAIQEDLGDLEEFARRMARLLVGE